MIALNNRKIYIDNLKGFAILLVVLGHCIQYTDIAYKSNIIFRYIYSFHMALFMFLSGFVNYKSEFKNNFLKKRFKLLIIPFFSWAIISSIQIHDVAFIKDIVLQPDNGLWFLWILFFINAIIFFSDRISKLFSISIEYSMLGFYLLFFLIKNIFQFNLCGFGLLKWYFPFFCFGFIVAKFKNLTLVKNKIVMYVSTILFFSLGFFWKIAESPFEIQSTISLILYSIYSLLVPLLGIISFFSIFINKLDCHVKLLTSLGQMTLGIYAVHFIILKDIIKLLNPLSITYAIKLLLILFVTVTLSVLFYLLVRKIKPISILLFGK